MTCHTYLQDFGSQAAHMSAAAIDAVHVRAGIDHPVSGDALAVLKSWLDQEENLIDEV